MLALRARASISDSLARATSSALQPGRALGATNDAARDWAMLSRIDPSDVFSKFNLINARIVAVSALWDLGRPREGLAKVLENGEFRPAAEASYVVAQSLAWSLQWSGKLAAELGQAAAAEKYFAGVQHFHEISLRPTAPESLLPHLSRAHIEIQPVESAMLQGDLARARAAAEGLRERLLAVPTTNEYERRSVAYNLNFLHATLGWVALQARDFPTAQEHFKVAIDARKQLPGATLSERSLEASDSSLLAITLAHAGRVEEARALAESALAVQREVHARQTDDQMHKLGLGLALVAAALATPDRREPCSRRRRPRWIVCRPKPATCAAASWCKACSPTLDGDSDERHSGTGKLDPWPGVKSPRLKRGLSLRSRAPGRGRRPA